MNKKLFGVIPPLMTAVDENGNVDEKGARNLIKRGIKGGVNGIFVLGTMGEFATVDEEQRKILLSIAVEEANNKIPILAGVGSEGLKGALRNCEYAMDAGADYIVLLAPYYFRVQDQNELKYFIKTINKNINIPLVIYNNPGLTKNNLEYETIVELSYEKNIVGLKESSSNFPFFMRLIREFRNREDFSIFQGDETILDASLIMGADGVVAGIGTLLPDMLVQLFNYAKNKDIEMAKKVQGDLLKILSGIYGNGFKNWMSGQKYALSYLGYCKEYTSTTYPLLNDKEKEVVVKTLKKFNIS